MGKRKIRRSGYTDINGRVVPSHDATVEVGDTLASKELSADVGSVAAADPFLDEGGASEWDYRAPSVADQVRDAQRNWDGPRCPHGVAQLPYGPDVICNSCEGEMADEARYLDELDAHDRTGSWLHSIGPYLTSQQQRQVERENPHLFPPPEKYEGDVPF